MMFCGDLKVIAVAVVHVNVVVKCSAIRCDAVLMCLQVLWFSSSSLSVSLVAGDVESYSQCKSMVQKRCCFRDFVANRTACSESSRSIMLARMARCCE
eukprot:6080464-Amphidinium_carterae.1